MVTKKRKYVVGIVRHGKFGIMENINARFPTLKSAREWKAKAMKSDWYDGVIFEILKEVE